MSRSVPILTYHHVNPLEGDMVTVSTAHFAEQMSYLHRQGFQTLFVSELVEWMQGKGTVPRKTVVLTFDDGYWDNYEYAFPILKKYALKATIFVVTGWIAEGPDPTRPGEVVPHQECNELAARGEGRRIALTWTEIKEMEESGLIRIEAHTHSHNKALYQDPPALKEDLGRCQEAIQNHLNRPSTCLCWPGGCYSPESLVAAQEAGFTALLTTERGINQPGEDLLRLKRVTVKDSGFKWLRKTIFLFSHPLSGRIYAKIKPK